MLWHFLAFFVPIFLIFLQTVFQSLITINGVYPELVLLGLLHYANSRGQLHGQLIGMVVGFIIDFLSEAPLGFFAFIYTLIGFIIGSMKQKIYSDSILLPILISGICLVIKEIAVVILAGIYRQIELQTAAFGTDFFLHMLYTLLLAPILFVIFRYIDKVISKKHRRMDKLER